MPRGTTALWMIVFLFHLSSAFALDGNPAQPIFEKALIEPKDIEMAINFEKSLKERSETPQQSGKPWFEVKKGATHVIVVAGHATSHIREGKTKIADSGTGSIALMLNALTDSTILFSNYQSPSDPNYYDDNDFKKTLSQLIDDVKPSLVLDLHASHVFRPYDVDFGTMNGVSLHGRNDLLQTLAEYLKKEGMINFSQDFFPAQRFSTVTKWVSMRGVPCIQIEISSTWLNPEKDELNAHRYAQLLQGLVRFIQHMDNESTPKNSQSSHNN